MLRFLWITDPENTSVITTARYIELILARDDDSAGVCDECQVTFLGSDDIDDLIELCSRPRERFDAVIIGPNVPIQQESEIFSLIQRYHPEIPADISSMSIIPFLRRTQWYNNIPIVFIHWGYCGVVSPREFVGMIQTLETGYDAHRKVISSIPLPFYYRITGNVVPPTLLTAYPFSGDGLVESLLALLSYRYPSLLEGVDVSTYDLYTEPPPPPRSRPVYPMPRQIPGEGPGPSMYRR